MCYSLYVSTDSSEDLSQRNSDLLRFERLVADSTAPYDALLDFPNKWYVGSESHCSCTFRHLHSVELGFGEPVDWYPEEQNEIEGTRWLYGVLAELVAAGCRVDLVDIWEGAAVDHVITLNVTLSAVSPVAFRLFENHKFRLGP